MSSRTTGKAAARERTAAMRAAQARAERRRRVLLASSAIGVVLVLVVALVIAKAAGLGSGGNSGATTAGGGSGLAAAGVVREVTSVPSGTLDKVGAGTAQAAPASIKAPALTDAGKPKVLYVGAEYCPFCAAERWPVVVALSRFGTWSHLGATASASNDVYPNTPTLSFHGATYTSDYLSFTGVETSSNKIVNGGYAPLDKLSAADQKVFDTYDRPPYIAGGSAGGIPFLDIGGTLVSSGASYDPGLLAGKTRAQIAAALADPTDPIAKAVDGSANVLTAAICEATGGQPATVCTAPGVTSAAAALAPAKQ
jgi:hypothetical protein